MQVYLSLQTIFKTYSRIKNENPNYIENATDKKYTLVPNEKIVYKALSFITNYLNINRP